MDDREYEAQRERVSVLINQWARALGLAWWKITIDYDREQTVESTTKSRDTKWQATFTCNADWRYADARILAYLPVVKDMNDEDLEQAIVHELAHVFLNELRDAKSDRHDHEERVATTLAKAFIWLRDSVREEAEKGETDG